VRHGSVAPQRPEFREKRCFFLVSCIGQALPARSADALRQRIDSVRALTVSEYGRPRGVSTRRARDRTDGTFVLAATPEFRQIAQNKIDTDKSRFDATPALVDGKIFLRSNETLYCIGSKN
jgi:hypothetical protein